MNIDYEIISERIGIRTAIPFLTLVEMEIYHGINTHGTVRLQAVVSVERQEEVCNKDWRGTRICIYEKGDKDIPLFNGRIDKLTCRVEGKFLQIVMNGIGETIYFDRKKKKRTFQNTTMTYEQMIEEIVKGYEDADYIWCGRKNKQIEMPVLQYEETDWEFFIRICSHFNTSLIPELRSGKPYLLFGMHQGIRRTLDEAQTEIIGNGFDDSYYQNGCYENGMPINQALCLMVRTKENWQMGDYVIYERQRYHVYKRIITLKNAELAYIYYLGTEGVYYQKKKYNKAIAGVRLEGTVRKTEGESVYVQLDIDKTEGADYPWTWAPETNNLSYCMPEAGTKATLYFPTREEKDGVAILAVVRNEKNGRYDDTQKREFVTTYQKKIGLYEDKLFVEGKNCMVSIFMEDATGIRINSNAGISVMAENEIRLKGKSLLVTAPLEVVCRTPVSNIELCRDINMYAPGGVRTVGAEDASVIQDSSTAMNEQEKQGVECWQASYSALAAIPGSDLSKMKDKESVFDLYTCGSIPKVAKGATVMALSEVMEGSRAEESSFPNVFRSMENYTVKGGYALPEKK